MASTLETRVPRWPRALSKPRSCVPLCFGGAPFLLPFSAHLPMSPEPGSSEAGPEPAGPPAWPPAALLLPPGGSCLRLRAEDAFHARLNQRRAYSTLPCLLLAIASVALLCSWSSAPPLTQAWLVAYCASAAATVAWLFLRPASFARWREVPAVLLGVFSTGLGLHYDQLQRLIEGFGTSGPLPPADGTASAKAGQVARHAGTLLAASGAIHLAVFALSLRTRLTLFAPTWLLVAITAWPFNSDICSTPPLSNPVAQAATAAIYKPLSFLSYCLPIPVAAWVTADALAECRTLLTFFQLSIGWLAPVLFSGLRETRLFQQHQLQRWREHLPLERGFAPWLYDSLWWLVLGGSRPHVVFVTCLLLAAVWDFTAFFCASPE